ncbi:unnamed protein product [Phytophthora lilii]|uniref:Unnamed protein product n=1 Tax=Phytophthora lilii TaxID=2077276 RepID=A0A9W6YJG7_9STRA|nr:unnamed protein product [Phytophthora lilii]
MPSKRGDLSEEVQHIRPAYKTKIQCTCYLSSGSTGKGLVQIELDAVNDAAADGGDKAALVFMGDLDILGKWLVSDAIVVQVLVRLGGIARGRAVCLNKSAALSVVPMKVSVRGGGQFVELISSRLAPDDLFVVDGDGNDALALEVIHRLSLQVFATDCWCCLPSPRLPP